MASATRHRRDDFHPVAGLQQLFGVVGVGHKNGVDRYREGRTRRHGGNGIGQRGAVGQFVGCLVDQNVQGNARLSSPVGRARSKREASGDWPVAMISSTTSSMAGAIMKPWR